MVVETRARVLDVLGKISNNGDLNTLQACTTPEQRREKLVEFFPEIKEWLQIAKVQLYIILQKDFGIFLEVCQFLEADGHYQFCEKTGAECTCRIPQEICVIRDGINDEMDEDQAQD